MGIKFGPSGNSEEFYELGYKASVEAPKWLKSIGLNAYEYSFGRGIKLGDDGAFAIAKEVVANDISLSVHAPYYINLATFETEKIEKNWNYIFNTVTIAKKMGAKRVVLHPGSCAKIDRNKAFLQNLNAFKHIINRLNSEGLGDVLVCPETMGKQNQLGTVAEIITMCKIHDDLIPTIDFGHLYARSCGNFCSYDDFKSVLVEIENGLGRDRMKNMHVHFSRIEYTPQGEKCHLTYDDTRFGPDFNPFAQLICEMDLTPTIICESKGTMAKDALSFKKIVKSYRM